MKFLNLNTLQTILSALLVALPLFLLGIGCTQEALGNRLDCSQSIIGPVFGAWATGFIAILKFFIVPMLQPGGWARNLFDPKVPVTTANAPGTVHPDDVVPPKP